MLYAYKEGLKKYFNQIRKMSIALLHCLMDSFPGKSWKYFQYHEDFSSSKWISFMNQARTGTAVVAKELLAKQIYIYNFEVIKLYFSSSQILLGKFGWLHMSAKFYVRKYSTFLKLFQSIQA